MNPTPAVVVVGLGQLGNEFARGLLTSGYPVVPVLRSTPTEQALANAPSPALVLVTVGEDDLGPALAALPARWTSRVGLVQNELLPMDWRSADIEDPTIVVVWFEKKHGTPAKSLLPSRVCGPNARVVMRALEALRLPAIEVSAANIEIELVSKNLYILLVNLAGLEVGGTVEQLWSDHNTFAVDVGQDILRLQEALVGHPLDTAELWRRFEVAVEADPKHMTTGRSAPRRLTRALTMANRLGVEVPALMSIASHASDTR